MASATSTRTTSAKINGHFGMAGRADEEGSDEWESGAVSMGQRWRQSCGAQNRHKAEDNAYHAENKPEKTRPFKWAGFAVIKPMAGVVF